MPRQKDAIWENFSEIVVNGAIRAKCKKCGVDIASLVARMKRHVEECRERHNQEPTSSSGSASNPIPVEGSTPAKQLKQSTLSVLTTTPKKQDQIDIQIARYIKLL